MSLVQDERRNAAATSVAERPAEAFGDASLFHRNLASMCRAQVPLPKALHDLESDLSSGRLRKDCQAMAAEVEAGMPFEQAYGRRIERFPPVYRALVAAGVASGDLPGVLDEIAVDAGLRARVREQLRRKLELPLFASMMIFAIGVVMMLVLTPMTGLAQALLPNSGADSIVLPTSAMLLAGSALIVLLLGIGVVVAMLRKPLEPGAGPHGLKYRLPFVGRLRSYAAKAGFAGTMALLLRRQMPLPEALELCAAGCDGREVQQQVERMAEQARQGGSLRESLGAGDLIPPGMLWFTESAASDAACVDVLEDLAQMYRQRLQRATDRVSVFALPIFEILIGLVVLSFAMAYVLPTYDVFGIFNL